MRRSSSVGERLAVEREGAQLGRPARACSSSPSPTPRSAGPARSGETTNFVSLGSSKTRFSTPFCSSSSNPASPSASAHQRAPRRSQRFVALEAEFLFGERHALRFGRSCICRGRQVAAPRPRRHARLLHAYRQLVDLAVELGRREADHVLAVQLLRDPREGRREVGGLLQLEVAAAGLVGDLPQPAVRLRCGPCAARRSSCSRARSRRPSPRPRAPVDDRAEARPARRVVAVGEDEDHAAPFDPLQLVEARGDRVPQPRAVAEIELLDVADELVAIAS